MNEATVRNWIRKAESDLKVARDEIRTEDPATDMVCFHAQQCAEKYLKAFLVFHGVEIPRTHNLAALISECMQVESDFQNLISEGVDSLTDYATELRYADEFYLPAVEEAQEAIRLAEQVRSFVIQKLQARNFPFQGLLP
ncbi:MAG: HEPN domain-containing protein [Fimbriimonadales bacterium]|nr:HEPN domain-containing protein [Fimbriimonadales bacterium]